MLPIRKLIPFLACLVASFVSAQEVAPEDKKPDGWRVWTDRESKRTLEGVITDKHKSGTRITIRKDGGGYVQVPIARLIDKDQDYARKWVKAQDAITVVTKTSRKGGRKTISIRAMAGIKPMTVKVLEGTNGRIFTYQLKAGEDRRFEVEVYKGYYAAGYHGNKEIDRETALKKTGLQE